MVKPGEVYENPVTSERAVIRIGTDTISGELLVVDLYVRPGGAVMGEHFQKGERPLWSAKLLPIKASA
jgi:hypothetical protein